MELEELDTNLVEIEELKCRTCLFSSEKTMCFTQINQLCSPEKSVKDVLIQMVPQLVNSVLSGHSIVLIFFIYRKPLSLKKIVFVEVV